MCILCFLLFISIYLFIFLFLFEKWTLSGISLEMKMDWPWPSCLKELRTQKKTPLIRLWEDSMEFSLGGSCRRRSLVTGAGDSKVPGPPPHQTLGRDVSCFSLNSRGRRRTFPTLPCCSSCSPELPFHQQAIQQKTAPRTENAVPQSVCKRVSVCVCVHARV